MASTVLLLRARALRSLTRMLRIRVVDKKEDAGRVMAMPLPYVNRVFNEALALGGPNTQCVNSVDAWTGNHTEQRRALAAALRTVAGVMPASLQTHAHVLGRAPAIHNGDLLLEYYRRVWAECFFGAKTEGEFAAFARLHDTLTAHLDTTFHSLGMARMIPGLGWALANYRRTRKEGAQVLQCIWDATDAHIDMAISRAQTSTSTGRAESFASSLHSTGIAVDAQRGNTLLAILTLDFVYNVMHHALVMNEWEDGGGSDGDRPPPMCPASVKRATHSAFLYPWRLRSDPDKWHALHAINLLDLGIPFSAGPRRCMGAALMHQVIVPGMRKLFHKRALVPRRANPPTEFLDANRPFIVSNNTLQWEYDPSFAHDALRTSPLFGLDKYVHVLELMHDPLTFQHIVHTQAEYIRGLLEREGVSLSRVTLVSPETRGVPFAGALAHALGAPLQIVRPREKTPVATDDTARVQTFSNATSVNGTPKTVAMAETDAVRIEDPARGLFVVVDDGVSTGGTALAILSLLPRARCLAIVAALQYTQNNGPAKLHHALAVYGRTFSVAGTPHVHTVFEW